MYRPFTNMINEHLAKYGLFSSQWGLLRLLKDNGPITFGDIATHLYIEKPSVTKLVNKLDELQLVEIRAGKDKREKIVHLTEKGEGMIDAVQKELKPLLEKALLNVSSENIEIARDVLAQLRKNLKNG